MLVSHGIRKHLGRNITNAKGTGLCLMIALTGHIIGHLLREGKNAMSIDLDAVSDYFPGDSEQNGYMILIRGRGTVVCVAGIRAFSWSFEISNDMENAVRIRGMHICKGTSPYLMIALAEHIIGRLLREGKNAMNIDLDAVSNYFSGNSEQNGYILIHNRDTTVCVAGIRAFSWRFEASDSMENAVRIRGMHTCNGAFVRAYQTIRHGDMVLQTFCMWIDAMSIAESIRPRLKKPQEECGEIRIAPWQTMNRVSEGFKLGPMIVLMHGNHCTRTSAWTNQRLRPTNSITNDRIPTCWSISDHTTRWLTGMHFIDHTLMEMLRESGVTSAYLVLYMTEGAFRHPSMVSQKHHIPHPMGVLSRRMEGASIPAIWCV